MHYLHSDCNVTPPLFVVLVRLLWQAASLPIHTSLLARVKNNLLKKYISSFLCLNSIHVYCRSRNSMFHKTVQAPIKLALLSTPQLALKKINPEYSLGSQKDWFWKWSSNIWPPDAKRWLIGKAPWCWERVKAEGEEGNKGWDGWMASQIHWTWTWANSGRWWETERPGMLQSMGSQKVGPDLVTGHQQSTSQSYKEYFGHCCFHLGAR